jgi:hypothetical protein
MAVGGTPTAATGTVALPKPNRKVADGKCTNKLIERFTVSCTRVLLDARK